MQKEKGKTKNEKVRTSILFTFSLLLFTCSAAVPLSWTVETSRAQPATFEAYQGETLTFEAALQSHGKPLEAPLNYSFFWQTNGMGSTYWEAPAQRGSGVSPLVGGTNVLFATWLPAYDVGAKVYNCFIGSPSNIYHAAFQLRLRPSPGALPNALPLPTPVIDFTKVRVLNPPWTGSARPLPKYLHLLDFDDSYPADAAWYYSQAQDYGSCSAVRDGNTLSRNYDWKFDETAEFIVRMSAGPGRFASVGVANCGTNLTEQAVTFGRPSRYYKCLPGRTVDGINEHGVVAEINVVDGAPAWHTTGDIHPLAAVRWVLDHATNAQHAASNLAARVKFPAGWTQNFHYMIADEASTYIVENGAFSNVTGRAVMTNFLLYPEPAFGSGWERYNLLMDGENITNAWFTQCYDRSTNPPWLSEFDNNYEHWIAALNAWERLGTMDARRRTGAFWQTVHTSIYNISNRILRVSVQEADDWYVFNVPVGGTDENRVREIAEAVLRPVEITAAQALDQASTANTHAIMAQATADNAASAAEEAQGTAEAAQTAADNAQTAADTAQATADNAASAAEEAQGTAEAAQTAADNAQTTADSAQDTADNAASAAEEAQGTAEAAQTAADNAQTAADTAQATADTAQSTADQAVIDAANAQATADQAEDDAQAAISLASGMIPSQSPSDESAGWEYDSYTGEWVLTVESSDSGSTKVLVSPSDVSIVYDSEWSSYRISLTSLSSEMSYISSDYYYLSDEIYRHKANYDDSYNYNPNPHGVTAHDVGSPTVEEVEQMISDITPSAIGAATQSDIDSAINGTDPHFKSQVIAAGLNIDPQAAEEINRLIERGSFESNCTVVVRKVIDGDREVRRLIVDSAKLYWDPGLQVTWQIDVTNGMFYSHIVSDQNLVNRIP